MHCEIHCVVDYNEDFGRSDSRLSNGRKSHSTGVSSGIYSQHFTSVRGTHLAATRGLRQWGLISAERNSPKLRGFYSTLVSVSLSQERCETFTKQADVCGSIMERTLLLVGRTEETYHWSECCAWCTVLSQRPLGMLGILTYSLATLCCIISQK